MRVTVLGGGVCGLTSALRIKREIPSVQLEVIGERIASRTAPHDITTSEGAAGLWKPFALSGTPDELVNRWGKETLDHYMQIYLSGAAPEAGILLSSAYELFEEPLAMLPAWRDVVPAFRRLTPVDIQFYDPSGRHVDGYSYDTIITEGRLYLGWICEQLEAMGVTITQRKITSIDEIESDSLIIDCCGLGSRELFADDELYGIRGHVLRVRAPWVRHHVESHGLDATRPAYIIPNTDTVVLGGTKARISPRRRKSGGRFLIVARRLCRAWRLQRFWDIGWVCVQAGKVFGWRWRRRAGGWSFTTLGTVAAA